MSPREKRIDKLINKTKQHMKILSLVEEAEIAIPQQTIITNAMSELSQERCKRKSKQKANPLGWMRKDF